MPSKTIKDFAYQVRDYMRSAEVVEGKNIAYSQENNAVIATIENGKSYKVRWTGSATVTLKKDSASGTEVTSGSTSPLSFTADSDFDLYFGSSADVTEIMVYDGASTDDTYEPYYVPVKDSMFKRSEQGVLGAKNLVKTTTSTTTVGGLTFTRNSDGTYTIRAGTANADIRLNLNTTQDMIDCLKAYKGKNVKLSGSPAECDATNNHMAFTGLETDGIGIPDIGSGSNATISNSIETFSNVFIRIWVKSGTVIPTDRTFKPMITLAEDTLSDYDHYQPYAMTNRELTNRIGFIHGIDITGKQLTASEGVYKVFVDLNSQLPANACIIGCGWDLAAGSGTSSAITFICGNRGIWLWSPLNVSVATGVVRKIYVCYVIE